MDPYRPGPTQTLLDHRHMGSLHSRQATAVGPAQWRLETSPATLWLPLRPADALPLHPDRSLDALWRLRFAVTPPGGAPKPCRQALLQVTPSYPSSQPWFTPRPMLSPSSTPSVKRYCDHSLTLWRGVTGFSCKPALLASRT
mgnify:CR=1 FL=1